MVLICEEWAVLEKVDPFFSLYTSITAEMVLVMFPAWKPCVWLLLGKIGICIYFWSTSKLKSFQPALGLKLKFLVWGNLARLAIMGWLPWASPHCRASQGPAPANLGSLGGVVRSPNWGHLSKPSFYQKFSAQVFELRSADTCNTKDVVCFFCLQVPKSVFF